jgi:hypothetical protein
MKHLVLLTFAATLFMNFAHAMGETSTDCLMMREQNERSNPKANLSQQKPKIRSGKSKVSIQ